MHRSVRRGWETTSTVTLRGLEPHCKLKAAYKPLTHPPYNIGMRTRVRSFYTFTTFHPEAILHQFPRSVVHVISVTCPVTCPVRSQAEDAFVCGHGE
jgi:hypothetical protein